MEEFPRSPTTNLEDVSLVAFLMLKGHGIKEWRNVEDPTRISFDIEGSPADIEADIQNYNDNEQVGIQDYVRCYKTVKSRMYNFKNLNR